MSMVCADGSDPLPTCPFDTDDPEAIAKHGFQKVPWKDRLSIHSAGGVGAVLVDGWTMSHANLPSGKWHDEFLDDDCVLIEDESFEECDPHTKLGRDVRYSRSGELLECSVAMDGHYKVLDSFDDTMSGHEVGTASLQNR